MAHDGLRFGDYVQRAEVDVSTAIYASGDVMSKAVEFDLATMEHGVSTPTSVVIEDYDDQGGALDVVFFNEYPGDVGVLNAAVALTKAQVKTVCGHISVTSTDYCDLGGVQVATVGEKARLMLPVTGQSLWAMLVSRDTKTYPTGKIGIKVGWMRS